MSLTYNQALEAIKQNKVDSIDLSELTLSDKEICTLIEALKNNTAVKSLNLSGHGLSFTACEKIQELLETNTTLTDLNLSNTNSDGESLSIFLNGLGKNNTLRRLELTSNPDLSGNDIRKVKEIFDTINPSATLVIEPEKIIEQTQEENKLLTNEELAQYDVYSEVRNSHTRALTTAESYALKRKETDPEKYRCLNLFQRSADKVLDLVRSLQEHNIGSKPLRFQCVVDMGHQFVVDIQIDDNEKSLVLFDSVDDILPEFRSVVAELIKIHSFQVYMAHSTVPNITDHTVSYLIASPEMCTEANLENLVMSDPNAKPGRNFYFIKNASSNEWFFFLRLKDFAYVMSVDKITVSNRVVTDEAVLSALNNLPTSNNEITPLATSEWTKLLLESSLGAFDALHQQKDFTSCEYFALHHAIQAGKFQDLHAVCRSENKHNPHFFIKNIKRELIAERPELAAITYVPWGALPSKFCIWSQSATFFQKTHNTQDRPRDDIRTGIEKKFTKPQ